MKNVKDIKRREERRRPHTLSEGERGGKEEERFVFLSVLRRIKRGEERTGTATLPRRADATQYYPFPFLYHSLPFKVAIIMSQIVRHAASIKLTFPPISFKAKSAR